MPLLRPQLNGMDTKEDGDVANWPLDFRLPPRMFLRQESLQSNLRANRFAIEHPRYWDQRLRPLLRLGKSAINGGSVRLLLRRPPTPPFAVGWPSRMGAAGPLSGVMLGLPGVKPDRSASLKYEERTKPSPNLTEKVVPGFLLQIFFVFLKKFHLKLVRNVIKQLEFEFSVSTKSNSVPYSLSG